MATAKKASRSKPRGIGLHIGLNAVDPKAYEGWDGPLAACENDAHDMAAIAKARGMVPTVQSICRENLSERNQRWALGSFYRTEVTTEAMFHV